MNLPNEVIARIFEYLPNSDQIELAGDPVLQRYLHKDIIDQRNLDKVVIPRRARRSGARCGKFRITFPKERRFSIRIYAPDLIRLQTLIDRNGSMRVAYQRETSNPFMLLYASDLTLNIQEGCLEQRGLEHSLDSLEMQ